VIYLIDTKIFSELLRNPQGAAAQRFRVLESKPGVALVTNVIVASEMRFGALKKASARLQVGVAELLSRVEVLALESGLDERYATVRLDLERRGLPIGGNDLLIAAHALALDAVLVTDNVREF
jgi:tRNA(fMet)-specific endonuclease VapC